MLSSLIVFERLAWRHDTRHDDTQHNDIKKNDIQHKNKKMIHSVL
jgi:hypothetical protein